MASTTCISGATTPTERHSCRPMGRYTFSAIASTSSRSRPSPPEREAKSFAKSGSVEAASCGFLPVGKVCPSKKQRGRIRVYAPRGQWHGVFSCWGVDKPRASVVQSRLDRRVSWARRSHVDPLFFGGPPNGFASAPRCLARPERITSHRAARSPRRLQSPPRRMES